MTTDLQVGRSVDAGEVGKELIEEMFGTDAIRKSKKKKPQIFRNWQDVGTYMKTMKKFPVVKKIKAASGDPKEDTFELIKAFTSLKDAQNFISSPTGFHKNDPEVIKRLSYLLWYLPDLKL